MDVQYMQHALRLARRGLGRTWPNPSVGAVIVKGDAIIGRGWTAKGGRPHAETVALAQAGEGARGATMYVTLEPCSYTGKTPPCADAIIAAGIARVVAACTDSNPKVAGKGFAMLRKAGIEVTEGVCEADAREVNAGFFSVVERGRPFVTLKLATSLDGKIATQSGESKWITGEASRMRGHQLRALHDAVVTGIGTALSDDPSLTCRLSGLEDDSPVRIVMDRNLRLPVGAKLLPAWVFTSELSLENRNAEAALLREAGTTFFAVPDDGAAPFVREALSRLAAEGITRLLVEAGSRVASAFLQAGMVDRIYWFRAPIVIGEDGLPALRGESGAPLAKLPHFRLREVAPSGEDILEVYESIK